jgi:hypothetical protein
MIQAQHAAEYLILGLLPQILFGAAVTSAFNLTP